MMLLLIANADVIATTAANVNDAVATVAIAATVAVINDTSP